MTATISASIARIAERGNGCSTEKAIVVVPVFPEESVASITSGAPSKSESEKR